MTEVMIAPQHTAKRSLGGNDYMPFVICVEEDQILKTYLIWVPEGTSPQRVKEAYEGAKALASMESEDPAPAMADILKHLIWDWESCGNLLLNCH